VIGSRDARQGLDVVVGDERDHEGVDDREPRDGPAERRPRLRRGLPNALPARALVGVGTGRVDLGERAERSTLRSDSRTPPARTPVTVIASAIPARAET